MPIIPIRPLFPVNSFIPVPNGLTAVPAGGAAPIAPGGFANNLPNGFSAGFQNSNGDPLNRPTLGQPMPPLLVNTPPAAATAKAVGNAVTFKVTAKAGATVNIYRNGILVSTVPASAAASIKVSDNPGGTNSFQVVVVDKNGDVSASPKKTVATQASSTNQTASSGSGKNKSAPSKSAPSKSAPAKTPTSKAGK